MIYSCNLVTSNIEPKDTNGIMNTQGTAPYADEPCIHNIINQLAIISNYGVQWYKTLIVKIITCTFIATSYLINI